MLSFRINIKIKWPFHKEKTAKINFFVGCRDQKYTVDTVDFNKGVPKIMVLPTNCVYEMVCMYGYSMFWYLITRIKLFHTLCTLLLWFVTFSIPHAFVRC